MERRKFLMTAGAMLASRAIAGPNETPGVLRLPLRSRVEAFKGSGVWQEVRLEQALPLAQTAIIICDMWDNHWCTGAAKRVEILARKMTPVVDGARSHGMQIIHAPSETMQFYAQAPQRRLMTELAKVPAPESLNLTDPPLPIDDSGGGCDTPDKFYKAWTRETATLHVGANDVISDNGSEIYSFLQQRGIRNLLVMGVHANICILKRTFAIRQMTRWGMRCILVRDLTDAMYSPDDAPHVSHEQGTELVIEHIEKYWCPSVLSADLVKALG